MNEEQDRTTAAKSVHSKSPQRGVYFLANDRVLDLAIAFLNSFRLSNPSLPLCLIPYDGQTTRISALGATYGFSIFEPKELLRFCDQLSTRYHPQISGQYRKLAAWCGPFDEFIYIDVDTVVLQNVDWIFPFLSEFEVVTSHSDIPSIRQFVWKDSIATTSALDDRELAYAANTGFIASKRGVLSFEKIQAHLTGALRLKEHMELMCYEQPLLNYLIVKCADGYTSLSTLSRTRGLELMVEQWGGVRRGLSLGGRLWIPGRPKVLLLHWAGVWQPGKFDWTIFALLRKAWKSAPAPTVRYLLPYRALWTHYRNQPPPRLGNIPVLTGAADPFVSTSSHLEGELLRKMA